MARHIDQQAENRVPERSGDNRFDPEALDNLKETQRSVDFGESPDAVFAEAEEVQLAQDDLREQFEVHGEEMDLARVIKPSPPRR